jgi:TPR repeat protein
VKRLNNSLADAGQARDWYRRAAGLGSVAAIYRLTELGLQDH